MPDIGPHRFDGASAAGTLLGGEDDIRGDEYWVYYGEGKPYWLALYTVAGRGHMAHTSGERLLDEGDLLLIRSGVMQDYGAADGHHWLNVWAQFTPRGEWLSWLDWPTIDPGVMLLAIPSNARPDVLTRLREMVRYAGRGMGRSHELGLNALEGALLLADECNPRSPHSGRDLRIRDAVDHLLANLNNPPSLSEVAAITNLSRSHFALLFREQVGLTPGQFIEQHRLMRVKRLLEYTRSSVQEIADEVGFSSPFYLSLRFKRHFGVSPSEYRRRYVQHR